MKIRFNGELKIKFTVSEKVKNESDVYTEEEMKENIIKYTKEELKDLFDTTEIELGVCEIIKEMDS